MTFRWTNQVCPWLCVIASPEHIAVQAQSLCEVLDILFVTLFVSAEFREDQIVWVNNEQSNMFESAREDFLIRTS